MGPAINTKHAMSTQISFYNVVCDVSVRTLQVHREWLVSKLCISIKYSFSQEAVELDAAAAEVIVIP